jgi:HKD family nuclease
LPKLDFILQAVTAKNHASSIKAMLGLGGADRILVSVAFVRESGLEAIQSAIDPIAKKAKFFVGIRNDITSVQAVKRLLAMKVDLYAVDTGSRHTIFHPKLYLITNSKVAKLLIGSANLTFGGLHNNIEAGTLITLDLANKAHKTFAEETINAFENMLKSHPQHVFRIEDDKHADKLFESKRLEDENAIPAPTTKSGLKGGERDDLVPMKLHRVVPPKGKPPLKSTATKKPAMLKAKAAKKSAGTPVAAAGVVGYVQVWRSKGLSRRDLNIPVGKTTNATGSIGLGKGTMVGIDHRHYFRDEVFNGLTWKVDQFKSHLEHADANFEVVVKNINYGQFKLTVRHNTATGSKSYKQKNEMTHLRWGPVKEFVASDDLLERTLYIYRNDTIPPKFMIEID